MEPISAHAVAGPGGVGLADPGGPADLSAHPHHHLQPAPRHALPAHQPPQALAVAAPAQPQSITIQKLVRRGYQFELLSQAKLLCDHQNFVDLTIYCEDGVVRAHQMLLATASPFLKLLFQNSPFCGTDEISLILPEVKACLVQALVHFVYTGTVVSREDDFFSLMKLVYALNINASIEAESTSEQPTTFSAPLIPLELTRQLPGLPAQLPLQPQLPQQPQALVQQQQLQQPPLGLATQPGPPPPGMASLQPPTLPTQLVALPTHPVPPAKFQKLSTSAAAPPPVVAVSSAPVVSHQPTHIPSAAPVASLPKVPIQLPTQPVPLGTMVNGTAGKDGTATMTATPVSAGTYIDPTTGISYYKVEMPNGPTAQAGGDSDPLAAIMNETIFTETSGSTQTIYTAENGQVVYSTQPAPTTVSNANATAAAAVAAITTPQPPGPAAGPSATSTPAANARRGKKRSAGGAAPGAAGNKENHMLVESVDDLPCAPDDDDINTPYTCPQCNKTIKGRVMLQAHHYMEHYDNPGLATLDFGDKHACRVCLKLFTRNSDVKAHVLRVHCGDRRYPCTLCDKRFKESTHLRKHLYTHTGERPHYCHLCNKGFQTSSDLKRHKRTRVHQEKVEQMNESGEKIDWADADDDDDDENDRSGNPPPPVSAAPGGVSAPSTSTGVAVTVGHQVDNTAQALLNSITQPVDVTGPPAVTTANSAFPVSSAAPLAAAASAIAATSGSIVTTAAQLPPSSTTIDMKALGGSAWNNNAPAAPSATPVSTVVTSAPATGAVVGQPVAVSSAPAATSSSTLDLKDIAGGSTVDINALKWQQQQQQLLLQQQQQLLQQPVATTSAAGTTATSVTHTQHQQVKRSSSVDSPGQDEEHRLTVVEGDDSSQDSVQQQQQQQQQQPQQQVPTS